MCIELDSHHSRLTLVSNIIIQTYIYKIAFFFKKTWVQRQNGDTYGFINFPGVQKMLNFPIVVHVNICLRN